MAATAGYQVLSGTVTSIGSGAFVGQICVSDPQGRNWYITFSQSGLTGGNVPVLSASPSNPGY